MQPQGCYLLTLAYELNAKRPEIGKLLVWLAGSQGLQALAVAGGCQLLQTRIHFLREQAQLAGRE